MGSDYGWQKRRGEEHSGGGVAWAHLGISLRVGRPEHNNLIHLGALLEVADLLADDVHLLLLRALNGVVRAAVLVRRNEVCIVDAGHWLDVLHVRHQLPLQLKVQDLWRSNLPHFTRWNRRRQPW